MIKLNFTDTEQCSYSFEDIISMNLVKSFYVPADQLTVSFYADGSISRFRDVSVYRGNDLIFFGSVDTQEFDIDKKGKRMTVTARSDGAKLIDNQAKPKVYSYPSLSQIISEHVKPYGISADDYDSALQLIDFVITPGTSEWEVISCFFSELLDGMPRVDEHSKLICKKLGTYSYFTLSDSIDSARHYYSLRKKYKSSHLTSHMYILNSQTGIYSNTVEDSICQNYGVFRKEYSQYDPDKIYAKSKDTLTRFKQQHLDDCVYIFCMDYDYVLSVGMGFQYVEKQMGENTQLSIIETRHIIDSGGERMEISAIPTENGY
ncbi:MAG: hypothetical protein ACI4QV_03550 [Acutalibacteraceae bacterium]